MVKIKGRIYKIGGSYAITISKALVDAEILKEGQQIELELVKVSNNAKPLPSAKKKEMELLVVSRSKLATADEEDEEEISEENDARCGIASLVLPEHPELVLFRPVRAMSRSLLWDAPVFEQVIDVEA